MIKSTHPKVLMIVESSTRPYYLGLHLWLGPLYILSYLRALSRAILWFDRSEKFNRIALFYNLSDDLSFSVGVVSYMLYLSLIG